MLRISAQLLSDTQKHLARQMPFEGVGLWLGKAGRVIQVVPLANIHSNPRVAYTASPTAVLSCLKQAEAHGLELLAIFHSHPTGHATPSESDRAQAFWRVPYVIVAIAGGDTRAWKLPELEEVAVVVEWESHVE